VCGLWILAECRSAACPPFRGDDRRVNNARRARSPFDETGVGDARKVRNKRNGRS